MIARLLPEFDQSSPHWPIVRQIVHAAGDPSVAPLILVHPSAVASGVNALLRGGPILTDVGMVAAGISRKLASKLGCEVVCASDTPGVRELASERGMTRSAAAMLKLSERIPGSIVAIGNAPTALFALIELLRDGLEWPALIVGTPVGFVGAAESKRELVALAEPNVPYITVEGTRGGSAMAVAAVNALLGAPLTHDFAAISLSDLLTPWEIIARRIELAAQADFVLGLYNPRSKRRVRELAEARDILLRHRAPQTPVGIVRCAYREEQRVVVTDLQHLLEQEVDMLTVVLVGNSSTFSFQGLMVTPRGYSGKYDLAS